MSRSDVLPRPQVSNSVQEEPYIDYDALIDIFPSCQGNGIKSWEVNDLMETFRSDEVRQSAHPSCT